MSIHKPTIILLNGPPGSGKDTAAEHLLKGLNSIENAVAMFERFSMPNKRAFAGTVNAHVDYKGIVSEWEPRKDEPSDLLGGKSYRNWQQDFSEKFMKPLYGEDIFGKLLIERVKPAVAYVQELGRDPFVLVPDSGFQLEVDTLLPMLGEWDIHLIRITSRGTYVHDTRQFVEPRPGMVFDSIPNDHSQETFLSRVDIAVGKAWKDKL